ncbi:hypothetical protein FOL47_000439 [Perkinsus chesapeaki]|uniref:Uncharacterized protein n=1 Tax=Perkinsus chesapeaki TaxID=330153 RepID=A0A7J6MLZ3_PERCH|nr:hypothetical protein FOL47_000439 [Perkinsus chesapeaki]
MMHSLAKSSPKEPRTNETPQQVSSTTSNEPHSWLSLAILLWLDHAYTGIYAVATGCLLVYKKIDRESPNDGTFFLELILALVVYPATELLRLHWGSVANLIESPFTTCTANLCGVVTSLVVGYFIRHQFFILDVDVILGSIALSLAAAELLLAVITGFIFSTVHYSEYGKTGPILVTLSAALMLGAMIVIVSFGSD